MREHFTCLLILATIGGTNAQPALLPTLGLHAEPADTASICTLPFQTPDIWTVGPPAGSTAADFKLYDLNGNAFELGERLTGGKPVLMISGSYTCWVFRNKVEHMNEMLALYGDQLDMMIVYTVEAHPDIDISPYFGAVVTGGPNFTDGILYQQPTTYGERKAIVQDMLDDLSIDLPVYIDGPCNAWWDFYGPAPNIAYIIGTDGRIAVKHPWYNVHPNDIECDIRAFLGLDNTCGQTPMTGSFSYETLSNDTVYGEAGTTLTGTGVLRNDTHLDALVRVTRMATDMPATWGSALCLDVCYLPHVDEVEVLVPAQDSLVFHFYFYTDAMPAQGMANIVLRNVNDLDNLYYQRFVGISEASLVGVAEPVTSPPASFHPNPSTGAIRFEGATVTGLRIFDLAGRVVHEDGMGPIYDLGHLPAGVYMASALRHGQGWSHPARLVLQR